MRLLSIFVFIFNLIGCASSDVETAPQPESFQSVKEFLTLPSGAQGFVIKPKNVTAGQKWVWYAPAFSGQDAQPTRAQNGWLIDQMVARGIAVVGVDVGESYGSPAGRATFTEFYNALQGMGYAPNGCMVLQSRGGLMGYTWILDNPGIITCVAGIYPLLSLQDYAGVAAFAPAWGVSEAWMNANMASINPLDRVNEINIPVFHVHGDQDQTTHYSLDLQFITAMQGNGHDATLITVPGEAHEFYSPNFFESQAMVQFLDAHL